MTEIAQGSWGIQVTRAWGPLYHTVGSSCCPFPALCQWHNRTSGTTGKAPWGLPCPETRSTGPLSVDACNLLLFTQPLPASCHSQKEGLHHDARHGLFHKHQKAFCLGFWSLGITFPCRLTTQHLGFTPAAPSEEVGLVLSSWEESPFDFH